MGQGSFAQRLRNVMDDRGFKQVDLVNSATTQGKKLGKSQLSQYVSGKTIPRPEVMETLAGLLGVSAAWLASGDAALHSENPQAATQPAQTTPSSNPSTPALRSSTMRQFKKSTKLDNVLYDVRGPVVDEAARMESEGMRVLKLNIGNPAPFGFRTPDEVVQDMRQQLPECEGYSDSRGLFSARKAIMQYSQLKHLPNVDLEGIYTGNGVSELINLCMQAILDNGDEILIPSPDYPLWTACATPATSRPSGTPTSMTSGRRSPHAPRPSSSSTPTTQPAPSTRARSWRRSSRSPASISS